MTTQTTSDVNKPMDSSSEFEGLKTARNKLLQNILNGSLIMGTILFFISLYNSIQQINYFSLTLVLIGYSTIFLVTFVRTLPFHVRVSVLSALFFVVGVVSLSQSGLNANGLLYFLYSILIIVLLEERRYWFFPFLLIAVSISILGFLVQTGVIISGNFIVSNNSLLYWIAVSVNFLFLAFLISTSISAFVQELQAQSTLAILQNSTLTEENKILANNLVDFEKVLDRRKSRLVTTRQISRELSQETSLDNLLHDSVDLIRSQLGYYHAAIYLADERNENAVLRAATGEAGRLLLERKHRLRIRDEGVVGYVIARGESRTAFDVSEDPMQYKNSVLPNTRSEMAVPLRVGTRIIGALDIQSDQIEAFNEEDVDVLQSIADQLSTTIDKTTQIQMLSQKVADLEEGYQSYTQSVWRTHLRGSKKQLNYVYKQDSLGTDYEKTNIADDAILRGEPIIASAEDQEGVENPESELAVPITLRNQTLGVLNIKCKGKTVPDEMVTLITNASDRLALALENARLLEQIQERAEREHLIGNISSKVRSAVDIDSILRTTAAELGKTLSIDEVRIQLKSAE